MTIDDQLTAQIVERVLRVTPANKIILFGSAATGTMTKDSDLDLLIVETEGAHPTKLSVRVHEALSELRIPFDVVVVSPEWFEASKNVIGGIAYPANKYGKVLFNAA